MNEQDQRSLYTAFVLLGLLMRDRPLNAIPELTKAIVNQIMKEEK